MRGIQWLLLVTVLASGVVLRVAFPERLAVEHFDEGVYASNLWFDAGSGGQYPARHFYAPPLAPALIEGSLLAEQVIAGVATRPTGVGAMLPSLLAGCLTLLIVWWMMQTWFGPAAALGATTLAALSEFHAVYSRAALTDVLLLPWMLLAVFLFERALARRHLGLLVCAGVACGLAWWAKYNGWLPLLITLGGLLLRLLVDKASRRSLVRDLGYWSGFALVAATVWSPFLWSLQGFGGYASVMANHATYVVGLSGWPESLAHQYGNLAHFDGWVSCLAPAAALLLLAACCSNRRTVPDAAADVCQAGPDMLLVLAWGATCIAMACGLGQAVVLCVLSIIGLVVQGSGRTTQPVGDDARVNGLAVWLIAAWFGGLFIATPLYSPYPRLTLTWLCASWLAGGLGIAAIYQVCGRDAGCSPVRVWLQGRSGRVSLVAVLLVALAVTVLGGRRVTARGVPAWQDRAGLRRAAAEIEKRIDVQNALVFVEGEPGLFYQLRAAGVVAVPGFDLNLAPASLPAGVTAYLATGLHAQRSDEFQRILAAASPRLEQVASIAYQPSDLVLLNNYRPHELAEQRRSTRRITLYRLK